MSRFKIEELRQFIIAAKKKGYASGADITETSDVMVTKDGDGSTTIYFEDGDWKYEDRYYGGEPFGGSEVVFYKGKAVWMMVYHGALAKTAEEKEVYPFLRTVLSYVLPQKPFRGPVFYAHEGMQYDNKIEGDIKRFFGEEKISVIRKDTHRPTYTELYKARYQGGLVNKR